MSTWNVNSINDAGGSGAPDFPNGAKLSGGSDILSSYIEESGSYSYGTGGNVNWYAVKVGILVVVTFDITIDGSATIATSAGGALSAALRPSKNATNIGRKLGTNTLYKINIATTGGISVESRQSDVDSPGNNLITNEVITGFFVKY